jgi:ABC-type branched-subunit amino acid transport system ATPase component
MFHSQHAYPYEILAIVDPSGAGKSTLLDILSARRLPLSGTYTCERSVWATFSMDCQTHSLASTKVAVVQRNYDRNWKQDICWKTLLVRNFLVMDDLLIQPMSTVSSTITLLNNLIVKEIGPFQEKVVEMGMDEVRFSHLWISILIYIRNVSYEYNKSTKEKKQ